MIVTHTDRICGICTVDHLEESLFELYLSTLATRVEVNMPVVQMKVFLYLKALIWFYFSGISFHVAPYQSVQMKCYFVHYLF